MVDFIHHSIGVISAPFKLYMGVREMGALVIIWIPHIDSALGYLRYLRSAGPSLLPLFGSSVEEASDTPVLGIARVENRITSLAVRQRVPYLPISAEPP